ncbi:MMPL family transporter [Streptomyces sp. Je 1-79]|uniref:MMPL family transporter n=1 Tax=Streptomyces sp. Je 1-79 TaxID=2943847 RepID=UPI0021A61F18|nr:MMPL family transporter [Streptomyces sp. Je 1-79]MCT4352315.1 MMPL family transporter [Streptomyces sp. Je 1-79]
MRTTGQQPQGRVPATVRTAQWCATHPWKAVSGWVLLLALCIGAGAAVGTNKGSFADFWIGEAGRAEAMASGSGLTPPPVEQVLIERGAGAAGQRPAAAVAQGPTAADADDTAAGAEVPTAAGAEVPTVAGAEVSTAGGAEVPTVAGAEVSTALGAEVPTAVAQGPTAAAQDLTAAAEEIRRRMETLPAVESVGAPVASRGGDAVRVAVTLRGDRETAKKDVGALLVQTTAVQRAHPGLTVEQTGSASLSVGVNDKQGQDLRRTEMISLPVTFLILLVVFGAVLAAGIPVLLALFSFAGAVGLYGLASWVFPDAGGAALSVIFMMGMAVGVDYSLFYLKRAREERERSGGTISHARAVELAAATSGRAVVDSGFAVALSLAGLYLVGDVIFSSIATGAILVTLVAVGGSLTVLPALLAKLGHRMDGGRLARRRRGGSGGGEGRVWAALLRPVVRRPLVALVAGVAVTVALAAPALGMRLGTEGKETFPDSVPAVAAYDRLVAAFPSEGPGHLVLVRGEDPAAPLRRLADATRGDALFAQDRAPVVRTAEDGRTALLVLPVPYAANSPEAARSLEQVRERLLPAAVGGTPGLQWAVSGEIAAGADYAAHQESRLPWVILFVSLATLAVMYAAFGSVVMAALGTVLNLAAVLVAWGVLTLVFQGTWAEGLWGFESLGFVGSRTPLMVFAILVGLSTDYQIFVVSRIREAVRRGVPTREAVVDGIAGSAGVVTSAAVIMVSVFVSFLFIDRIEMKQIAVGLTVAVLFDAIVLRAVILPSAMALLGDRAWWPRRPSGAPAPAAASPATAGGEKALVRAHRVTGPGSRPCSRSSGGAPSGR